MLDATLELKNSLSFIWIYLEFGMLPHATLYLDVSAAVYFKDNSIHVFMIHLFSCHQNIVSLELFDAQAVLPNSFIHHFPLTERKKGVVSPTKW